MIAESTEQFLSGGGEMGKLIRSMDWSKTALGPISLWPQSLRTSVSLCLSSTFPILIAWGDETIQIYNDSYRPICGAKHPEAIGMNFRVCWETALAVVGDAFTRGQHGEGTYINDQRMMLDRYGYLEEAWMTFSFAPIRDETGGIGGIFHPITETTVKMLSGRRTQVLRDLGAAIGKAKTIEDICRFTEEQYEDYQLDIPFLMIYEFDSEMGNAKLLSASGLPEGELLRPEKIELDSSQGDGWPLAEVRISREMTTINELEKRFGTFTCKPYPETPVSAVILPLKISGQEDVFGFVVAGVSARRALDQDYLNFYNLLENTYNTAISNVYAYEQEQKRAEALAAIDRSKTAFFSNVSHEFRTPLTLMLGPLEDLLSRTSLDDDIKIPVEATHRNALRLLKLVNNLLDYSRVEAGRVQAAYQQTDLAELTTDLSSSFRSIIEKAGMELSVFIEPLKDAVFVDRQMWEKIVLNLLSNAFKYTLRGNITVTLKQIGNRALLEVHDTGVGIPEEELPHMFERFHRVENAAGRTHEGTGIGLSLVHELVHLHGGDISVSSTEGQGSTFRVSIPTGTAHLPQENILSVEKIVDSAALKGAFMQEAFSLLQNEARSATDSKVTETAGDLSSQRDESISVETRILIVDDNADMRAYLTRLLEPYFTIYTAVNGLEALTQINEKLPDLVLSDMMMPVMDGKAMLAKIRSDQIMENLPVIFLSARAGEEARIDGLEAGADDYLVKPFSAAELLTKVRAQIKINKARGLAAEQLRELLMEAPVAIAIFRGPEHRIEMANNRMLHYWGRTGQETIGKPFAEALPELANQNIDGLLAKVLLNGERVVVSEIAVNINRYEKEVSAYVNLTIEALKEKNALVSGVMVVAADVTEQVTARKNVENISDRLRLAMDASGMGIWQTIWGSDILEVSPKARAIHGIHPNEVLSFDATLSVVVPEHRDGFKQAILSAVEQKGGFSENYQIQPFDGSKRKWLNSTGKVELNEQGEVISVIGTILDITESKEDELRKDDFIGMVSHELKTPLTSLNGYTQMLISHARKSDDTFSNDKLDKVQNQIKKMSTLINGFLNVSRFESGKIHLKKKKFDLSQLITEMIEESELDIESNQLEFFNNHEMQVTADRDKIGSVLSNLFSNAIKYSGGKKSVKIESVVDGEGITISVSDEGMGIKPHDLEKLFDRYYRVEAPTTLNISGFGIGLYLSAEIINRHGGKIWATSEVGKGSTFYFQLPY